MKLRLYRLYFALFACSLFSFLTDTFSLIKVLFKFGLPHLLICNLENASLRYSCCCHKTNGGHKKGQASHGRPRATDRVTSRIMFTVGSGDCYIFHLFLKHGRQISVQVTGKGIGLEILATYTFCHKKESKILKLKEG